MALAKNRIPGAYLEDLCFEAQQAAEKAVKAVLISREVEYPYVHDLARLLSVLEDAGETVPCVVRKAEELTPYALHYTLSRTGQGRYYAGIPGRGGDR